LAIYVTLLFFFFFLLLILQVTTHNYNNNSDSTVTVMVTESERDLAVDAATQQLIQSVLSEADKAAVMKLEALNQQHDQLHRQIDELV